MHGFIFSSKEKVFTDTKANWVKKKTNQTYYFKATTASMKPGDDTMKDKWVTSSPANHLPVQRSPYSEKVQNLPSPHAPLP